MLAGLNFVTFSTNVRNCWFASISFLLKESLPTCRIIFLLTRINSSTATHCPIFWSSTFFRSLVVEMGVECSSAADRWDGVVPEQKASRRGGTRHALRQSETVSERHRVYGVQKTKYLVVGNFIDFLKSFYYFFITYPKSGNLRKWHFF